MSRNVTVLTQCQHQFCQKCLKQWIQKHSDCPLCRQTIDKKQLITDIQISLQYIYPSNNEYKYHF